VGITAGSREVPGRNACDRRQLNNNNNNIKMFEHYGYIAANSAGPVIQKQSINISVRNVATGKPTSLKLSYPIK